MKMAHSMQGIYSPLPQSLSDSDSEKEISMEPICTSYNSKNPNGYEENFNNKLHNLGLHDDIVKIKRGASKMSTARKIAFLASIVLCFLPIIIFLWVLPCSELHTCPVKISNWEREHEGVEFKGPISRVEGAYETNHNLAVMYKGSFNSWKSLKPGVVSFIGLTGSVAWDFEQKVEPLGMDCLLIDINKDGKFECVLVDSMGLKVIETVSGATLWHAHSSESSEEKNWIRNVGMPVVISDLNNDGVEELLSVYKKLSFLILSGKTGLVLANIPVAHCKRIIKVRRPDPHSQFIAYNCLDSTATYRVSFPELEKTFKNVQYHMIVQPTSEEYKDNIFTVAGRKLVVDNGPNCTICHCTLTLLDQTDKVQKTWTYNNSYILNPKPFVFGPSAAKKLRGHLNGFILKIWEWSEEYEKLRPTQRINKRSLPLTNETFFITKVTETVVLITFNDTNIHEINASSTVIKQICRRHERNCQPSVENHLDSLLVDDLEGDGSTELVSFRSSYVEKGDDWNLVSYVKMLRLEEELAEVYESK